MKTARLAKLGVLLTLSLLLFMVERLFPPIFPFAPFIHVGLGNTVILLLLSAYGLPSALLVLVAKCLIAACFSGPFSLAFSLSGGLLSLGVEALLFRYAMPTLSLTGIGGLGAAVHNAAQLGVYALFSGAQILGFMPITLLVSLPIGALTGFIASSILRALPEHVW